jgi:streptogramin lyase
MSSFFPPPKKPLPAGYPLAPIDANGRAVRAGDLATILTIPHWLTHDLPQEEVVRLKVCEGKVMRIVEIDAYGTVWFGEDGPWFCLRPSEIAVVTGEPDAI